jgi:monoamine oxidase
MPSPDVLIVGAGAAGLSAALELARGGLRVEILEARDRIGGRMFTQCDSTLNYPVELGAEFIHGLAPEIWQPLQQHKVRAAEVEGDLWCSIDGKLRACDFLAEVDGILSSMDDFSPDESFLDFLSRRFADKKYERAKQWATDYVSGFNAADPDLVSVHWLVHSRRADEQIEGERAFHVAGGYQKLIDIFLRELAALSVPIHLNTVVHTVNWIPNSVQIRARISEAEASFSASRTIVTLPIGVLQAKPECIVFAPELPAQRQAALKKIVMGKVVRVTLCFRDRFWKDSCGTEGTKSLNGLSFLFSRDEVFPTWWTQMPERVPIITGWAPASSAERLAGMSESIIVERALKSLSSVLHLQKSQVESQLTAAYFHDWDSDPFSRGAYSYVTAGGEGCQQILAAPIANTLFFAGEATDTSGHNGTVHGAIASGKRAATEILHQR